MQGHVAYPHRADNPIRGLVTLIVRAAGRAARRRQRRISDPSHLEFTSVDVGNTTVNLIPGEARARFNIRFNDQHTLDVAEDADRAAARQGGRRQDHVRFDWEPSNADVFFTQPGPFTELVATAIAKSPAASRHCPPPAARPTRASSQRYCPVVEFGLVGQTMHQVDERVPIADLRALTAIYRKIASTRYFAS